jgi:Family of unknown function (DUF6152)
MKPALKGVLAVTLLLLFALIVNVPPVFAHHGFQAEFDGSKVIYITGTLTKLEWENPHAYFWVEAKDASGKVTTWNFEGASPIAVKRTGTVRADFTSNIGKTVTVRAIPGKDGTAKGAAETIKLPDGREVVVGGKRFFGDGKGGGEY